MALTLELVPSGYLHARSVGAVDAGAGFGQVPAPGAGLLLKVLLPFAPEVYDIGFRDQCYFVAKPLDAGIASIALDAQQFEDSPQGVVVRFRVDVASLPAGLQLSADAEHTITR